MSTLTEASPASPPVVPVIGRSDVTEWLQSVLERTRSGQGGAYLLLGEVGLGKSTLIASAVAQARREGLLVLEGRAVPREIPQPFEALKTALAHLAPGGGHASEPNEPPLPGLWIAGGTGPSTLLPMGFMAWQTGSGRGAPGAAEEAGATDRVWAALERGGADVEEDRLALFDVLQQALASAAQRQPVLLVLEDLQNTDRATVEFLRYLSHQASGARVAVLMSSTPLEGNLGAGAQELKRMLDEGALEVQHLRPLNVAEVADYLRWLHGGKEPDADTVTRLFAESEGHPLFLERLARGERGRRRGPAAAVGAAAPAEGEGPEGPLLLIAAPDDLSRRLLVYGAVIGPRFPFGAVAQVAEEDEERVARTLERLVRERILVEGPGEVYEFREGQQRSEVLASLTDTRRRRVHRRLGEVLETLGPGTGGELPWVRSLSDHFHEGAQDERSLQYATRLFELARKEGRVAEQAQALGRAVEASQHLLAAGGDRRAELLSAELHLAETLAELGELGQSERRALQSLRGLSPREASAPIELALSRTHLRQGRFSDARRRAEPFLPPADEPSPTPEAVEAAGIVAEVARHQGRTDEAQARAQVALRMAERSTDRRLMGESCRRLADFYLQRPEETARARALYQRAQRLFDEAELRLPRERVELALAEADFLRGRSDEGFARLARVGAWAQEVGARLLLVETLMAESHYALDHADLERASRALERARVLLPPSEGPRFELAYNLLEGRHAHVKGDAARGRTAMDRAESVARSSGAPAALFEVLLVRAEADLARGDREAARRWLKEAKGTGAPRAHLQERWRKVHRALEDAPSG